MNNLVTAAPAASLRTYKPSAADERYIGDGLGYLNMTTPFWASILYSRMVVVFTHDVPYAATDSHYIYVNVAGMRAAGWTFEEVAFVLAHEVMHYILGHLIMSVYWRNESQIILPDGTLLPYHGQLMNAAMDFVINAALVDGKVGKFPSIGLYDKSISAKGMEGCVEIYAKLYKETQGGGKDAGQGKGFDLHLDPSAETIADEKQSGDLKRAQAIATAKMVAEAAGMGELPAAIKQLIGDILEPKVYWGDHLKATMQRAAGEPGQDWSKLNKRLISRPAPWGKIAFAGRSKYGCGTVVVGYDTSGSCIFPEMQQRFFTEMSGIVADLNPAELIVVWCDATVQRVDRLDEPTDLEALRMEINELGGAPGGGGTSFIPVFEWIRENHVQPDMLVYLTDTLGRFPTSEPDYPVIWASTRVSPRVPFGTVVEVPEAE